MWWDIATGLLGAATRDGGGVLGAVGTALGVRKKRARRRRTRLTARDMAQLSQIKAILGKTAAAAALPFYMR